MIQGLKNELGPLAEATVGSKLEDFVNSIENLTDTQYDQFGPHYDDDAADKMQVIACCEDGYDYPNQYVGVVGTRSLHNLRAVGRVQNRTALWDSVNAT